MSIYIRLAYFILYLLFFHSLFTDIFHIWFACWTTNGSLFTLWPTSGTVSQSSRGSGARVSAIHIYTNDICENYICLICIHIYSYRHLRRCLVKYCVSPLNVTYTPPVCCLSPHNKQLVTGNASMCAAALPQQITVYADCWRLHIKQRFSCLPAYCPSVCLRAVTFCSNPQWLLALDCASFDAAARQ